MIPALQRVGCPIRRSPGQTVVCHLTGAYRRLQRPSSPLAAKASTVHASSLDHITQNSHTAATINDTHQIDTSVRQTSNACIPLEYLDFLISQIVKELPEGELQDRIKKPVTNNSDESLVTGFFYAGQQQTSKRVGPCLGRHSSR